MMKLYFSPGACSLTCHIALEESGLPYEAVKVDLHQGDNNAEWFLKLNPMGAVPVLELDNGQILTQNVAILEYIAGLAPAAALLPKEGTFERAQAASWLSFVSSDFHKAFGSIFGAKHMIANAEGAEQFIASAKVQIHELCQYVDSRLAGKEYLLGDRFSAPDAYLFTVYSWMKPMELPTEEFHNLNAFAGRVHARPAVQRALKKES